jgi:sugar fermentation stimulation protein A
MLNSGYVLHSYFDKELNNTLEKGKVVKRPSATVKSPYMADILLFNNNENKYYEDIESEDNQSNVNKNKNKILAHTPSLGCSGYVDKEKEVLLLPKYGGKTKSSHSVEFAYEENTNILVGTNPNIANAIVYNLILNNMLSNFSNYENKNVCREKTKGNSRFDVYIKDNNNVEHFIEIKTAPVKDFENNCAIFPKGYRKKKTDTFSPRAIKHLEELSILAKEENTKCYLIFVVPRKDVEYFTPCKEDPLYCKSFINAVQAGVKMISFTSTLSDNNNDIIFDRFIPVRFNIKKKT